MLSVIRNLVLLLLVGTANAESFSRGPSTSSSRFDDPTDVALVNETSNIVGGLFLLPDKVPFFASTEANYVCGSSLLWPDVLITAAHCKNTFNAVGRRVYIGGLKRDPWTDAKEVVTIRGILPHPKYQSAGHTSMQYDVMLVFLNELSKQPRGYINSNASYPTVGQELIIVGHGTTNDHFTNPSTAILSHSLKVGFEKLAPDATCAASQSFKPNATHTICTESINGVSCSGDSGGPLMDYNLNIVGLSSFGSKIETINGFTFKACTKNVAAYARVSTYFDWILESVCAFSKERPDDCPGATKTTLPPVQPTAPAPTDVLPTPPLGVTPSVPTLPVVPTVTPPVPTAPLPTPPVPTAPLPTIALPPVPIGVPVIALPPVPIGITPPVPISLTPPVPTGVTPPVPVGVAPPVPVGGTPTSPISPTVSDPTPGTVPSSPVTPVAAPPTTKRCGFFRMSLFCLNGCGIIGRILGLCQ